MLPITSSPNSSFHSAIPPALSTIFDVASVGEVGAAPDGDGLSALDVPNTDTHVAQGVSLYCLQPSSPATVPRSVSMTSLWASEAV